MKVVLAGGGTGGHLYPAIAVAEKLEEKGVDTLFMVSNRGIEREILSKLGFKFIEQRAKAYKSQNILHKINSIFSALKEVMRLKKYFAREDKVILFGGFAAFVSGVIGLIKGCDIYIHEQNSVMGLTNRFFAKYAKKVFLSFDKTLKAKGNIVVSGNPIRSSIFCEPKDKLGKTILLIGGSQGSRLLNSIMAKSAKSLIDKGFKIVHQTGKKLYDETVLLYKNEGIEKSDQLTILDYLENIHMFYKESDVIISRAGSGSIFEIMQVKRPAIFVPLKAAADNHQYFNALYAKEEGFGYIIEEGDLTKEKLLEVIDVIYKNYESSILPSLKQIKQKDAVSIILEGIGI